MKNVSSAQYMDDEMYEISSTKRSQDRQTAQIDDEPT